MRNYLTALQIVDHILSWVFRIRNFRNTCDYVLFDGNTTGRDAATLLQIGTVGRHRSAVEQPEAYGLVAICGMTKREHAARRHRRSLGGTLEEVRLNHSITVGHTRQPFVACLAFGLQQHWCVLKQKNGKT